ncbi:hypothetical protein AX14_000664 [Amanita brunnescens Koide BX004]|nr:hypothetical protein AX14_000664 [Amanita brunnescens Koide BX004]
MAQEDINCHLVLKAEGDIWPMKVLFEESLRLRGRPEAPSPSGINSTEATVRLTGTHANSPCQEDSQTVVHTRPSLRRNSTYPLDSGASKPCDGFDGISQSQPEGPTLVAELQQRHGLTKKKVYGVKPPRTPFFRERDDTPFDPYRRAALPFQPALTDLSLSSPITLTPGGRCATLSRLDRMARLNHRSPTDTSPRYWHQSASRLSSPENEAISASPPTSTVTKAIHAARYEQPITPTSVSSPYNVFPQADQQFPYTQNIYDREMVESSPRWPNAQSGYLPQHNYTIVPPSQPYDGVYASSPPADVYNQSATSRDNSPTSQHPSLSTSIGSRSSTSHRDRINNPSPHASSSTKSSKSAAACSNPKDDEPFTFDPEYVAATTAMFRQEVLPAYPEYSELANSYGAPSIISSKCSSAEGTSSVPGYTLQSVDDYSPLPYIPPSKAGQLYAMKYYNMTRQQRQAAEANAAGLAAASASEYTHPLSYRPPPTYTSGSSSLTGWAG